MHQFEQSVTVPRRSSAIASIPASIRNWQACKRLCLTLTRRHSTARLSWHLVYFVRHSDMTQACAALQHLTAYLASSFQRAIARNDVSVSTLVSLSWPWLHLLHTADSSRCLCRDTHRAGQHICMLGSCRVQKEDSVGAGPQNMFVNVDLFLMARYAGQSNSK